MLHRTKTKGDLAVAKTIMDLTARGFAVLTPTITEHLPFDLVVYKNNKFRRIQVKYSCDGHIAAHNTNGISKKIYKDGDFDFYAVYLPKIDKIVYPSISYRGCRIRSELPNSSTPFFWWEDFLKFTSYAKHKTLKDFGKKCVRKYKPRCETRKVSNRPSKTKLVKLVKKLSIEAVGRRYNVSGNAIRKWLRNYGINPKNVK